MSKAGRLTHLLAALFFSGLALYSSYRINGSIDHAGGWRALNILSLIVASLAWLLCLRAVRREAEARSRTKNGDGSASQPFPEGQAKLIDSGRLPNRYNPHIDLKEFEICHFTVPAQRLIISPLPEGLKIDPGHLAIRFSGGSLYYIVRPQELLLPAAMDDRIDGELAITNQRILFLAPENGFEVQLQSVRHLDCSAHLVDFQVRERRYTLLTESAGYAEKVLHLLQRQTSL